MASITSNEPTFHWYQVTASTAPLEQGDFLNDFPIVIPPAAVTEVSDEPNGHRVKASLFDVKWFNVVVMTQSCDLARLSSQLDENEEDNEVIFCPRYDYQALVQESPKFGGKGGWKNLINGRFIGAHIVNECEIDGYKFDYQVIDLQRVFSVPLSVVRQVAAKQGDRVRLLPPYREHLAQAFARQFMRVGLPIDLPRNYPYKKK